ncbi:MAG: HlyC/CorC family transporter [Chloroflexi bacterium]|nr:HlyC/CorC family transporter [Chloroflexota bacterium]
MILAIILFLILVQFLIFSSYEFLNNLPVRSLLIPETDDVEESARNAKEVNKILSYLRVFILLLTVLTTSLLHLLYSEYISSNQILIITLSSITSILYLFLLNLFFKLIPDIFLEKFIFISKIIKALSSKFVFLNGNSNFNDEHKNGSDEIEVFEAAGLSVDNEEMEMIKGILKMDVVKVREIMKPRVDLVAIEKNSKLNNLTQLISDSGYSKIPVIGESIDDVKGIVYAKDTLKMHLNTDKSLTISEIMRPAIFVPESQNLEQLLSEFQDKRTRIAIVIDEHGGISGLVTVTDLIEEIVGELVDEFDEAENIFYRINPNNLIVDAKVSISDLNDEIGSSIQINGYDTIGGLVYKELGKMPVVGDRVSFEGIEIVVQSTIGRRIGKLRIRTK